MKYALILLVCYCILACNPSIEVLPKATSKIDSVTVFNFKAYADANTYRSDNQKAYKASIELYLRGLTPIDPNATVKIGFSSKAFGVLLIAKDTLYPDDQLLLKAAQFKQYRQYATYLSIDPGKQSLNFNCQIGQVNKQSTLEFENK